MGPHSIRPLSLPGDPSSSEATPTRKIACEKPNNLPTQDEKIRCATISVLPDGVLLDIFDFYQSNHNYSSRPVWKWHVLVHVCQRWRHIIFSSPQRLKLQILCTHGTPVRKYLGIWPAFPIIINFDLFTFLTHDDEHNIIATLEHPNRVCSVNLYLTGLQLGTVVTLMQKPFPLLTRLCIDSMDRNAPVFPADFLGGSAPCLQEITLSGIPFPALPALLLSASDLITLTLQRIPPTSFISPETMGACLASLPQLESFIIEFQSDSPHPDHIRPPPVTRTVLPSLTTFHFQGVNEYLEDLISHIDGPQLNRIVIAYLNQPLDFRVPQLSKFIERSVGPQLSPPRHAYVCFDIDHVDFTLYRLAICPGWDRASVSTSISSDAFDLHVYDVAEVLSQFSASFFTVIHLELDTSLDDTSRLEGADDVEWPHLFRQFPALQKLYVPWRLAEFVALALVDTTGETVTEALPFLDLICLEAQPASILESLACRLSDRPVTVVNTRKEFDIRLNSYIDKKYNFPC